MISEKHSGISIFGFCTVFQERDGGMVLYIGWPQFTNKVVGESTWKFVPGLLAVDDHVICRFVNSTCWLLICRSVDCLFSRFLVLSNQQIDSRQINWLAFAWTRYLTNRQINTMIGWVLTSRFGGKKFYAISVDPSQFLPKRCVAPPK